MPKAVKELAIGVAGGIIVILITAIWGWISVGGLVRVLGGASQAQVVAVDKLLDNAIVLTEQECAVLGVGWIRHEEMGGRFPLGAGKTEDSRQEEGKFEVGDKGGAYLHQLMEPEMPIHRHSHRDRFLDNRRAENRIRGDRNDKQRVYTDETRDTGPSGGNQPHNNMPPYLTINFCRKAGNPN